ncbi:MAG: hypothetical protein RSA84_15940 [Acinetobacter sp.]
MKKHLTIIALLLTTVHAATAADWDSSGSQAVASVEFKENTNISIVSYGSKAHRMSISQGEVLAEFALTNKGQTSLPGNAAAINVDQEYRSVSIASSGYYKMLTPTGKSILVVANTAPDWMKKGSENDPMIAWSHELAAGATTSKLQFAAVESKSAPEAGLYKIGATAYYKTF